MYGSCGMHDMSCVASTTCTGRGLGDTTLAVWLAYLIRKAKLFNRHSKSHPSIATMPPRGQKIQPRPIQESTVPWRRGRGRGRGLVAPADERRRNFEFIASVSRSSGLEKDGDTLKNASVQEEYRGFVQEKLQGYWKQYRTEGICLDANAERTRVEMEGNILIMFRKLREGISSSKRQDDFAIEVYETSLHLSVIFSSSTQTMSILSHLLPDLYATSKKTPSQWTVLLALLHSLLAHHPSQQAFYDKYREILPSCRLSHALALWIKGVARSLHRNEPLQLSQRAQLAQIEDLLPLPSEDNRQRPSTIPPLHGLAVESLLEAIRDLSRQSSWRILRSAYHEFGLPVADTRTWLTRQLLLPEVSGMALDAWLKVREEKEEISQKEGAEGRWVVKNKR
ncbi:hypothetical protein OF83DRAFT_932183 [Amylostereum chailletii]|nr:hypothetical protein OF83DRAFT_932183 [Amylostereum chailletii]